MPQLSPVIVPAKVLKDGRHKVRIRIAHNGRSAYILTDIIINSASEFRNGQIVRRKDASYLNTRLTQEINKYQQAIDDIEYINGMSVQDVIECIKSGVRDRYMTLQDAFEECMASAKINTSLMSDSRLKSEVTYRYKRAESDIEREDIACFLRVGREFLQLTGHRS